MLKPIIKTYAFVSLLFITLNVQSQTPDIRIIKQMIFEKTNELRLDKGLNPLFHNDSLEALAQYHSNNMVKYNFFGHIDSKRMDPNGRAKKFGINIKVKKGRTTYIGLSENLAYMPWHENVRGCGDTRSNEAISSCIFEGWVKSKGHYRNMINSKISEIGIGVAVKNYNGQITVYSTQNFR